MLVTLREVLPQARRDGYAVGLFNTVNLEMARGVLAAAQEARSPVIIGTAEILLPYAGLRELADFLVPMARRASVPVVLHYDHGLTKGCIEQALALGFTSVMLDASTAPYEENLRGCREVVALAGRYGASVEAELGHVGDGDAEEGSYTDPGQAREFAEAAGIDALAVAIGTAHGPYRRKPRLDVDRLRRIAKLTGVPLVLHGGSGLSDADFRGCIAAGISKVNIFTDINRAAAAAAGAACREGCGITDMMLPAVEAVKQETLKKMRLFGSCSRA